MTIDLRAEGVTTYKMPGRVISIQTFPASISTPLGIVRIHITKMIFTRKYPLLPFVTKQHLAGAAAHTCTQAGKEEAGESLNNPG